MTDGRQLELERECLGVGGRAAAVKPSWLTFPERVNGELAPTAASVAAELRASA